MGLSKEGERKRKRKELEVEGIRRSLVKKRERERENGGRVPFTDALRAEIVKAERVEEVGAEGSTAEWC